MRARPIDDERDETCAVRRLPQFLLQRRVGEYDRAESVEWRRQVGHA